MRPRDKIKRRMTLRTSEATMIRLKNKAAMEDRNLNWIINNLIEKGFKYEKETLRKTERQR